jgi:hypothetical protein
VFENRVLRRIFGSKRDEVTGGWRKLHNEELHNLIFISMALPAHSGPWPIIQLNNHFSQTVGLLGGVISLSQGSYLNTGQHRHRINVYTYQTCMP